MNSIYKDIDEYIAAQPAGVRPKLEKLRETIQKAVPKAEPVISYQMPAFKYKGIVMFFASFKNHYSFFLRPMFMQVFKEELKSYDQTKSAVHIPLDKPVPVQLVTKIAKYIAAFNEEKEGMKKKTKRSSKKIN